MALSDYSEFHQKVINEIRAQDKGFHSQGFISDVPFADIAMLDEAGGEQIMEHCAVSVSTVANSYQITLLQSKENQCWYVTIETANNIYRGILHFNVMLGAREDFVVVFVNDNEGSDFENITRNIKYSDILILEL